VTRAGSAGRGLRLRQRAGSRHLTDYAEIQIARVARTRGMSEDQVRRLVKDNTAGRFLGLFGEKRVNVLKLNLALDGR
jgi:K+-transporting ATPase ATPase C chain